MVVIIEVVASVVVAVGTITAGVIRVVSWLDRRSREKAKLEAELEDLRKRIEGQ